MPSSYSIYEVTAFPTLAIGQSISAAYQGSFLPNNEEPPQTVFTLQRTIDELHIDVHRVLHEFLDKQIGRVQGVKFVEFVSVNNFPAYFNKEKRVLMIKANKFLARGAMKQITEHTENVRAHYRSIILDTIRPHIDNLKGAWFKVDDSDDVSSQALFGPNIDRDARFERASAEGPMNFVTFIHRFKDEFFHVGISNDGNVVLYDNNLDEYLELELVMNIKGSLLDIAEEKQK